MTCTSKNIIICFTCRCQGCFEKYIGQTGDILRNRVTVHRHKELRKSGMSEHISMYAGYKVPNLKITTFNKMKTDSDELRKKKQRTILYHKV